MGKYEKYYERLDERFRAFIKDVKSLDRLSQKVSKIDIGKQYEKASAKLHYDSAALEKSKHNLMKEIERAGLSGYVPENVTYYPSNFHEVK